MQDLMNHIPERTKGKYGNGEFKRKRKIEEES